MNGTVNFRLQQMSLIDSVMPVIFNFENGRSPRWYLQCRISHRSQQRGRVTGVLTPGRAVR